MSRFLGRMLDHAAAPEALRVSPQRLGYFKHAPAARRESPGHFLEQFLV